MAPLDGFTGVLVGMKGDSMTGLMTMGVVGAIGKLGDIMGKSVLGDMFSVGKIEGLLEKSAKVVFGVGEVVGTMGESVGVFVRVSFDWDGAAVKLV